MYLAIILQNCLLYFISILVQYIAIYIYCIAINVRSTIVIDNLMVFISRVSK